MLVQLGKRAASEDVLDLLTECHGRIRRFLSMARELASTPAVPPAEVAETAGQIRRYFVESFPLHMADEDVDIFPRVAHAVETARVGADHVAHAAGVAELVATCEELQRRPEAHTAVAPRLAAIAARLATELEHHLELEERTIFPALQQLSQADRDAIRVAMRARRSQALAGRSTP